ncbi:MAG: hypothetical protein ABIK49_04065 [candidate division WOR-3 bacterium]
MRFKPILITVLIFLGCSDMLLYRSGANYFPLPQGATWKYLFENDTIYVQVDTSPAVIANRNCIRVYRNFAPEYYTVSPTEIEKLIITEIPRPNKPDTVEFRFGLRYRQPLVLGDSFQDSFDTTLFWGQDTVKFLHSLRVRVSAIDSVLVPAGKFYDCYRLEFCEMVVKPETTITQWIEFLAPDVGVVKREYHSGEKECLIEYRR